MSQSGFQYMVQRGKSAALRMADRLTPVLKDSKFRETGIITPEEFVAAGDNLVYHCPTWSWESGDPSKKKSYLPDNKQFLVTKNVPCYRRCHQMEVLPENEKVIKLTDDDEGWVDTHHGVAIEQISESVQDMKLDQSSNTPQMPTVLPVMPNQPLVGGGENDDDDDDDDDDEPVEAILQEDDPAVLSKPPPVMALSTPTGGAAATPSGGIMQTRTYDLNITYDNYYRTPRLWLFGYDEHQKPLTEEQMYEDISQDHLNKTVTLEDHPHLPPPSRLSVHPCRHADVMKKIMKMIEEDGRLLEVHSYLLVFLKFVQAVIPTIEYDYTQHLALVSA